MYFLPVKQHICFAAPFFFSHYFQVCLLGKRYSRLSPLGVMGLSVDGVEGGWAVVPNSNLTKNKTETIYVIK